MKKLVLKMDLYDERIKRKAMKTVCSIPGVKSMSVNKIADEVTLLGDFDPVHLVGKLRKFCHAEIVSIGPAEEEKKEEEPAKEEKKEEEPKRISGACS